MAESSGDFATVIGADARFKGQLEYEKGVRLLGRLEGQVTTKGDLLVAEGATLEGEVDAGNVRVDGDVRGNLKASGKIHLSASAKLQGDLHTARLEVADGAVFVGHCVVGPNGSPKGSPQPAHRSAPEEAPAPRAKEAPEPQFAGKK
jgi:cytoskeletal protein CcmA (bactofilin family)